MERVRKGDEAIYSAVQVRQHLGLAWLIDYTSTALQQLGKFNKPAARRIVDFMGERITTLQDTRETGKALTGPLLGQYWRYRVGNYRVICDIQDNVLCVLVVEVGSRKDVHAKRRH